MNLSQIEFDKLNKLEFLILTVEGLTKILLEYDEEKDFLIGILSEKIDDMKNQFDDLTKNLGEN